MAALARGVMAGCLLTLVAFHSATAQTTPARSGGTTSPELAQALFKDLQWRNIGPANIAGRITDIEAVESNPAIVFMASASGGIFKSTNAGATWTPIFDKYGTGNIGDVAVYQKNPDIIYVGTGESCVRNSVAWGDGVYKSTDGGRTFVNIGLRDTHHISEVLIHPNNPDIVYVAAQGHLWGHTGERGVFRTTDGGRTWTKLTGGLPGDTRTGASDLVMDPQNPNVLYAGMWERIRMPHRFLSGGPNGGIYKTTDGGDTWTKLTDGLPAGDIGKVGLAVYRRDPRILVAQVEHGYQPPARIDGQPNPEYSDMSKLGSGLYRSEDGGRSWTFVNRHNDRPFYYTHVWIDPNDPQRVYVLDNQANVSEDGGRTFDRELRGIEGDFHALWIDPSNSDRFYIGNDKGPSVTYDRGQSFFLFDNLDIAQFYAITLDSRDPYWVYGGLQDNGNWGGISNSRDFNGILTDHWFKFHSADGFHATADPNDWTTVYTESENGGIRRTHPQFRQTARNIKPNPTTITNFRQLFPSYDGSPTQLARGREFRFNWSAPIALSPHDSKIVYLGGNYLYRSTDRGDTWTIISPDLSTRDTAYANPETGGLTRDASGAETHATIITLAESPLEPGVIWAGTDDGNVQITRDGGKSWTNVRTNVRGVPERTWVSRVEPSRFDAGTAYVTFDGHRRDDFRPHVYKTTDYGRTWTSLAATIPQHEPVYVIKEDLQNRNLLFIGTEFSLYASVDAGRSWHRLMNGFPTVAVHDLEIHSRDNDLVAGTHGRSIWILDDITPLQQLTDAVVGSDVHMFRNRTATRWRGISRGATRGHFLFMGRNPLTIEQRPPSNNASELQNSATVSFWLKTQPAGPVQIEITNWERTQLFTANVNATQGINRYYWPLRFNPPQTLSSSDQPPASGRAFGGARRDQGPQAEAGTYRVRLTVNGVTYESTVTVRDDPDAKSIL